MPSPRLICLITPGHIASTPRLTKEADALIDAGFRVHVVAGRHFAPVDPLDVELLAKARWQLTRVDYRGGAGVFARKALRRISRRLLRQAALLSETLVARAHHAETLRFAALAARIPADYYIGHCLAGLPAAAIAARSRGVRYGFDAEDFHDAETAEATDDSVERVIRGTLHAQFLPGCAHMTAASPLIAKAYADAYGVATPRTVLNVFPLAHAPTTPVTGRNVCETQPARCYWFSQTVGPGRGLETMVRILGRLQTPVELHLRGHATVEYQARLQALARSAGLRRAIVFLPSAAPDEMVRLAAPFDLGLALEETQPLNRDLCLTNKIFTYLLAGIPQLLSPTRAQSALAPQLGHAALLASLERPDETARALDTFFADPARVSAARESAWRLARERYCWDLERAEFLRSVSGALEGRN